MTDKKKILQATHSGTVPIGNLSLPCFVLDDGTRVLSERGLLGAFGMKAGARDTEEKLPRYLRGKNIVSLIDLKLREKLEKPIWFKYKNGAARKGVPASLLPDICDVWLRGRDAGVLLRTQVNVAVMADILMRGLAQIGIIALIDEATGYQKIRDDDTLQKFLAIYLSEEKLKWAKTFPDEYYKQLFRLRGWDYNPMSVKRPVLVGKLTNQIVYEKLPDGVLDKLRELNPINLETKRRKSKHFQHLSDDIGQPDLRDHILQLIPIMRISSDWNKFKRNFARAFPVANQQSEFNFDEED